MTRKSMASAAVLFAIVWPIFAADAASSAGYEPDNPSTRLFDTGTTAGDPLPATAVAEKKGWVALAEEDVTHNFAGDAVLLNDRLAVLLRARSAGAELYTQTASAAARQASIVPVLDGSGESTPAAVRIVENSPAAVTVEVGLRPPGTSGAKLVYRLTTGQAILELRPGEGVRKVRVEATGRYLAVPDFFGDDMVFTANGFAGPRLGLPAENFFLHFVDRGNCLLMCVWPSSRQQAAALLAGPGSQRTIQGSEIECLPGKSLWIAALAAPGIWHEESVAGAEGPAATTLDWKPPFPAKWRASLAGSSPIGPSWYIRNPHDADQGAALPADRSPCCLDAQRGTVQIRTGMLSPSDGQGPRSLVIYPIDRTRTTPLAAFSPIDILRATLGVGPCQYILQTEGLASDTNPTPDSVMTWVEKQFSKRREKKAADEIRDLLAQMVDHVGHAEQRIEKYAQLARDVRSLCEANAADAAAVGLSTALRPALDYLEHAIGPQAGSARSGEHARKCSAEIIALIGTQNAAAECRRLAAEVRRIGAAQDRALANCRMATRWLRQQVSMLASQAPDSADLGRKIERRIDETLTTSTK